MRLVGPCDVFAADEGCCVPAGEDGPRMVARVCIVRYILWGARVPNQVVLRVVILGYNLGYPGTKPGYFSHAGAYAGVPGYEPWLFLVLLGYVPGYP